MLINFSKRGGIKIWSSVVFDFDEAKFFLKRIGNAPCNLSAKLGISPKEIDYDGQFDPENMEHKKSLAKTLKYYFSNGISKCVIMIAVRSDRVDSGIEGKYEVYDFPKKRKKVKVVKNGNGKKTKRKIKVLKKGKS